MQKAIRALGWTCGVATAVIALTGVLLVFRYRPNLTLAHRRNIGTVWTAWHVTASVVLVIAALALLGLQIIQRFPRSPYRARWVGGVAVLVLAIAGFVTGPLVGWDQLAVRAVTVASDFRGVLKAAFSDQIRFVLFGHSEVSQGLYRFWMLVHVAALPLLAVVAWALQSRIARRLASTSSNHVASADVIA